MSLAKLLFTSTTGHFNSIRSTTSYTLRSICISSLRAAEKRFSEKHEWVSKEGNIGIVGISTYAQESLGDVVYVQLPDVGADYSAGDEVGAVESVKAASEIYTPVSGKVAEVNSKLEDSPNLVNRSPYGDGWIFKIQMSDESEFNKLMSQDEYENTYLKSIKH